MVGASEPLHFVAAELTCSLLCAFPEHERLAKTSFELEFKKAVLQKKIDSAHEYLVQKGVDLPSDLTGKRNLDSKAKKTSHADEAASSPAIAAGFSDDSSSSRRASFLRPSLFFNGDNMPSRWMAREQARDRLAKEENRCSTDGPNDSRSAGEDDDSILRGLVSQKDSEIADLEQKAESVTLESADIRAEMSRLQASQDEMSESFNEELASLTHEIEALEGGNEELTHRLVESSVHCEEKIIYIDILAKELKAARDKLEASQRGVHSREREIKRDHRTRQRKKHQSSESKSENLANATADSNQVQYFSVPLNDDNINDRRQGFKRDSSNATDMSAISFDSSQMIDILDVELTS